MRLNCSGFGRSLFVAGAASLVVLLATSFSIGWAPSASAQATPQATSDEANVEPTNDDLQSNRRARQIKRARRAREASLANHPVESDASVTTNLGTAGSGANFNHGNKFDGPGRRREFAGAAMNMRLGNGNGGLNRSPLDLSHLNLTDEQKARITEQRGKSKSQAKELQQAIKAKRIEMRDMMFDPTFNADQIRAKRSEVRKMQDQAELLMLNDFLSMRAVLTPEQLRKLRPNIAGRGRGIADASTTTTAPEPRPDVNSEPTGGASSSLLKVKGK